MTCHWISTQSFTVVAHTDAKGIIVRAAPLVKRFIGQPVGHLLNWSIPFGGLRHRTWESARNPRR